MEVSVIIPSDTVRPAIEYTFSSVPVRIKSANEIKTSANNAETIINRKRRSLPAKKINRNKIKTVRSVLRVILLISRCQSADSSMDTSAEKLCGKLSCCLTISSLIFEQTSITLETLSA